MALDGKRILVAGATGLAGSAIMADLLRHAPAAQIRGSWHRNAPFLLDQRIEYLQADLSSREECQRVVAGCDCAVLAAARTSGAGVSASERSQQVTANTLLNMTLLEALVQAGVKRVVMIGSASVYQDCCGYLREDQLDLNQDPPEAYLGVGWVNRYLEKLSQFWHQERGIEIVTVRAANIFGPFSRFDPRTSNFIPALVRKAVDRMDPFEVWGAPGVTRDVVYVEDFARAVVMLLERDDIRCDVFNVGTGVPTTVGDVVGWALRHAGHQDARVVYNDQRPSTVAFRALDCSKIRRELGWEPTTGVEQGIERTVNWWRDNRYSWSR